MMFTRVANFRRCSLYAIFLPGLMVFLLDLSAIPRANARQYDYLFELDRAEGAAINQAYKINRSGEIVGHGHQAYLFSSGRKRYVTPDSYWSEAVSLNDDGTIVGAAAPRREPGTWPGRAFFCKKEQAPVFLDPGDGAAWSYARDINNVGDIVLYTDATSGIQGYVYHANETYDLIDSLGGSATYPLAINNAATPAIAGASRLADGKLQAFVWTKSSGTRALATPTGKQSFAIDINDNGTVLGWIGDDAPFVPWQWLQNNTRDPKGAPNTNRDAFFSPTFTAVNTSTPNGVVVIWDAAGNLLPPLTNPTDLIFPTAIDNRGRIVGNKTISGGALRAVIYDKPVLNGWQELSSIWSFFSNATVPLNSTGISESGDIVVWVGSTSMWTNSMGPQTAVIVPANTRTLPAMDLVPIVNGSFVPAYFPTKIKPGNGIDVTARVVLGQMGDFPAKTDKFDIVFYVPNGMTSSPLPANCTDEQVRIRCTPTNSATGLEATLRVTAPDTGVYEIEFELDTNLMIYEFARTRAHVQIAASPLDTPPLKYRRVDVDESLVNNPNVTASSTFYSPLFSHAYSIASDGRAVGRINNHSWIRTDTNTSSSLIGNACTTAIPPTYPCLSWLDLSAINTNGDSVGMSGTQADGYAYRRLADGSTTQISTQISRARAINDSGVITGTAQNYSDYANAFVYDRGVLQSLGTLGGHNSYGMTVTPSGSIFGSAEDGSGVLRPFSWTAQQGMRELTPIYPGQVVVTAALDNGAYAGSFGARPKRSTLSQLTGQNPNAGPDAWFYGDFQTNGHAFISDGFRYSDLGFGEIWGLNNKGMAVGTTHHRGSKNGDTLLRSYTEFYNAFLWDDNLQQKFELDTLMGSSTLSPTQPGISPYYEYISASGINDNGDISGWRYSPTAIHAFVLKPDPAQTTNNVGIALPTYDAVILIGDSFTQNIDVTSPNTTTPVHVYLRISEDVTPQNLPTECSVQHRVHVYCNYPATIDNATRTIALQFKANNAADVTLLALAGSEIPDADTTNNRATSVLHIVAPPVMRADLKTSLTISNAAPRIAQGLTLTAQIDNLGRDTADQLQLDIVIPAALQVTAAVAGCTSTSLGLQCTATSLAANDAFRVSVPVRAIAIGNASITAHASSNAYDEDLANNDATLMIAIVPAADLVLSSPTATPLSSLTGQEITLSYNITNRGPSSTQTTLDLDLPGTATLTRTPNGCAATMNALHCAFATLAPNDSRELSLALTYSTSGDYTLTMMASGDAVDPDPSNNVLRHRVVFAAPLMPAVRIIQPSNGMTWQRDLLDRFGLRIETDHWPIAAASTHYHWFLDGTDQGAVYSVDPIDLTRIAAGDHVIKVVLANVDHTLTDVSATATLHVDENSKYAITLQPISDPDDNKQANRTTTVAFDLAARDELGNTIVVFWSLDKAHSGIVAQDGEPIVLHDVAPGEYQLLARVLTLDGVMELSRDSKEIEFKRAPNDKKAETSTKAAWDPWSLLAVLTLLGRYTYRRSRTQRD